MNMRLIALSSGLVIASAMALAAAPSETTGAQPASPERGAERMMSRYDANHDGQIELATEVTNEQRREQLSAADANHDGALSLEEVGQYVATRPQMGRGQGGFTPESMMERLDTNHDGQIDLATEVTQDRRRERMTEWDTNHDGKISLEELQAHMETMQQQGGGRFGPGRQGGQGPQGPGAGQPSAPTQP
jgi:Ca2+-binding EF-hand superfamily protein